MMMTEQVENRFELLFEASKKFTQANAAAA
jgi:hypothetical protein